MRKVCSGGRLQIGDDADDPVDNALDQHRIVALGHHADQRLGARRADDETARIAELFAGIVDRLRAADRQDDAFAWVERDWAYRYGQSKWEADEEYLAASFVMTW